MEKKTQNCNNSGANKMLHVALTPAHQQGSSLTQPCLLSSVAPKQSSDVLRGKKGPAVQTSPNSGNESVHRVIMDSGTMPESSIRVTHNMPAVGPQASHTSNLCPHVCIIVSQTECRNEGFQRGVVCFGGRHLQIWFGCKPSTVL